MRFVLDGNTYRIRFEYQRRRSLRAVVQHGGRRDGFDSLETLAAWLDREWGFEVDAENESRRLAAMLMPHIKQSVADGATAVLVRDVKPEKTICLIERRKGEGGGPEWNSFGWVLLSNGSVRVHPPDVFTYQEGRRRALKKALAPNGIGDAMRRLAWQAYRERKGQAAARRKLAEYVGSCDADAAEEPDERSRWIASLAGGDAVAWIEDERGVVRERRGAFRRWETTRPLMALVAADDGETLVPVAALRKPEQEREEQTT